MVNQGSIKVWDLPVRLFHWLLVAGFFFAYFAEGEWLIYHIWVGYGIFGLIGFRLVWGFVGPTYARFADFVYGPRTVIRYLAAVLARRPDRFIGHNPAGGAMIVALLVSVLLTVWTGVLLYGGDAWLGPLAWLMQNASNRAVSALEFAHSSFANVTVALCVGHVFGVVWESLLHRENLIKAMVTGRKPPATTHTIASLPDHDDDRTLEVPGYEDRIDPAQITVVNIVDTGSERTEVNVVLRGEDNPRIYTFADRQQALSFYQAIWTVDDPTP